jgi:diacylglycerol kinase (ATP)
VVVNPAAGGGRTRRLWPSLRDELHRAGLDFESAETSAPGAAAALARSAAAEGFPLVVAVGGDGTVNEVVDGLTDPVAGPRGALGIVMTGRGGDVCRNLGVAADRRLAVRRLAEGRERRVDLGLAAFEGSAARPFLIAAGAGFDAVVAERARGRPGPGTLPYVRATLESLAAHRSVRAAIQVDDDPPWSGTVTAAVVANGAHFGGGMKIAPAADPADGWLDVVILGDFGRLELLRWLPSVYRGRHLASAKVTTRRGRSIRIEMTPPAPIHLDGEPAGQTPVRLAVRPGALRLVG